MNVKITYKILALLFILFAYCGYTYAQDDNEATKEETTYEPILKLSYLKNTDGIKILKCTMLSRVEGKWTPIENATVVFSAGTDSLMTLGEKTTNNQGIAIMEIDKSINLPEDENGVCTYHVEYKGTENSEANSEELSIADVNLELNLEEIDSVKTISVKATKKGAEGEMEPLTEEDVNIYIKRLYSNLKVGTITLDEEGLGSIEYELIPGDSIGNIKIIARIDDHEEYGNVEVSKVINWGTPVDYSIKPTVHEIWTSEAPIWMTVTVIIFVLGVWYHLVLIFIRMSKIKKLGKNTV